MKRAAAVKLSTSLPIFQKSYTPICMLRPQPSIGLPWKITHILARAWSASPLLQVEEPLRKRLKDEQRRKRIQKLRNNAQIGEGDGVDGRRNIEDKWRLTIGIEIHAQLNTARKLFSDARTSSEDEPNTNVALFDLALPGAQPRLQKATLIPALRAAIALNCRIQRKSKFDRKHYFYQDQPNGYQITQYYEPYALNGHIFLTAEDRVQPQNNDDSTKIHIKQIQLEQDTAKSTMHNSSDALLDFNRVGHPLIEIISQPELHSAQEAVWYVRNVQSVLQAVNAVTTGMELGGLRADVNVSVAPIGSNELGQRVEIKNLNTFQSIEAAIAAEQDRQVDVLESGGTISGETRGWSLGSIETTRLRGKEGEVDYRYMPDPDIPPLLIGEDLISHVTETLPSLPSQIIQDLVNTSGLTLKDAKTLATLDDGARLDYFDEVNDAWRQIHETSSTTPSSFESKSPEQSSQTSTLIFAAPFHRTVANWILHELPPLLLKTDPPTPFTPDIIPSSTFAHLLHSLHSGTITRATAKCLLASFFHDRDSPNAKPIERMIEEVAGKKVEKEGYAKLVEEVLSENSQVVEEVRKGKVGKIKFLIGMGLRKARNKGEGGVEPKVLEEMLKERISAGE